MIGDLKHMTIGDIEKLQRAYESFKEIYDAKWDFINAQQDEDNPKYRGEPLCGYPDFDATVTDYNYDLAERGEHLADAVAEALGIKEER